MGRNSNTSKTLNWNALWIPVQSSYFYSPHKTKIQYFFESIADENLKKSWCFLLRNALDEDQNESILVKECDWNTSNNYQNSSPSLKWLLLDMQATQSLSTISLSSRRCFARKGTILGSKLACTKRHAISAFEDVTTRNIYVMSRAWSWKFDEILRRDILNQKSLINYAKRCWISFPF